MSNPNFMTLNETAEMLRYNPRSLQNKVSAGKIPHFKVGGKVLFDRNEILAWIESSNSKRRSRQKLAMEGV